MPRVKIQSLENIHGIQKADFEQTLCLLWKQVPRVKIQSLNELNRHTSGSLFVPDLEHGSVKLHRLSSLCW